MFSAQLFLIFLLLNYHLKYPGYEAHGGTPQDGTNFKLLLRELRDALDALGDQDGRYYGLTVCSE